jgi:pimeloyl-ACP methyl ester carboxylesterase
MPTTPNGTAYTVYPFTSSAGEPCWRAIADSAFSDEHVPLVIFCHGNPGTDINSANQQFGQGYTTQRNWLMDNGWGYVEGHGAGANWGNQDARAAYRAMYVDTLTEWDVGWNVVLGRSMGGLIGAYLAARDPMISRRCRGFVSLSGTADLTNRYSTASASDRAALLAAYDAPDESSLMWAVRDHDPLLVDPAAWYERRASIQYDTGDASVPPAINALPWIDRFGAQLALLRQTSTTGGDHNSTPNSPTHAAATIAFLAEVLIPYEEPSPIVGTKVSDPQILLDGTLQRLTLY